MIKLSGLTPAVFTPFDKTGAINLAQIQPYADKLVTDGRHNIAYGLGQNHMDHALQ